MSVRGAAIVVGLALIALSAGLDRMLPERRSSSVAVRLLGPLARPLARVGQVRARTAMLAGRTDLALARASAARSCASPRRSAAWPGCALGHGQASAREPGELALLRGLMLGQVAQEDAPPPWPGGVPALWSAAAEAFARAAELGHPEGGALEQAARAQARELGKPPAHR